MMAFGAFHPNAQKDLTHKCARVRRLTFIAEERHRTISVRASLSRQQFADELIVGLVLLETVTQPQIKQVDRLYANPGRIRPD